MSASALALAACPGADADEPLGESTQAVIGGHREDAFLAAGYLVREGLPSCSAVLVEPDRVLTAAHCVDGHHDIQFGWGEVGEHPPVRSIARAVHPRFVSPPKNGGVAFEGFDVALLQLERAAGVPPASLGVAPRFGKVHAIGYGATSYVARDGGALEPRGVGTDRREIEGAIRSRNETELFIRYDVGMSACYGDSGGPLFAEDGSVVGILSRFTELGRCLPKDRSLMGYIRVDAMSDFFREARACLSEDDVQSCLRADERHLCAPVRFDNREVPTPLKLDRAKKSTTIDLRDRQEVTLTVTPESDVDLMLDSNGDARMRVTASGATEPIADRVTRADLEAGKTYSVVIGSCNGAKQPVVVSWQGSPRAAMREARDHSIVTETPVAVP